MFPTQKKTVRTGKLVDTSHVNRVIRNYKHERWVHNSKRIGKEDSLSVWYGVEEVEAFLRLAKEHGADGIKVYFGAYDNENAPLPQYSGRQTVVFVATKAKETAEGMLNKDLYISTETGNTILAFNLGTVCPPFCTNGEGNGIGITIIDKGDEGLIIT